MLKKNYSNTGIYQHFATMAKESNDKVGCCYVKYTKKQDGDLLYNHLFTCNYRENNFPNTKTYQTGEPVSQCYTWGLNYTASNKWTNLCTAATE